MKKRVTYLDLAKGIGIILVVLGHMENINAGLRTWISSFHMPLFFVISGMLIALKNEDKKLIVQDSATEGRWSGLKTLTLKKARGILVPYAWFSLIYIPIDIMNLFIENVDKHTFIQNIFDSLTFSGISVMWFLPALFIAEVAALFVIAFINYTIQLSGKNKDVILKLIILAAGLIISLASFGIWNKVFRPTYDANAGSFVMCTLLGFVRVIFRGLAMSYHVLIGYVMYMVMAYVDAKLTERNKKGELSAQALSLIAGVIIFTLNLSFYAKNGDVDNHFLTVSNMLLYYVCAFLGSMAIILICKGFDSIKPIDFLGRNSLIIMATHLQCYILYAGILIAIAIDVYVTRAKSYIYMFNSVLFTMLIEAVIILIINKFFPFIVGKKTIKETLSSIFKKSL